MTGPTEHYLTALSLAIVAGPFIAQVARTDNYRGFPSHFLIAESISRFWRSAGGIPYCVVGFIRIRTKSDSKCVSSGSIHDRFRRNRFPQFQIDRLGLLVALDDRATFFRMFSLIKSFQFLDVPDIRQVVTGNRFDGISGPQSDLVGESIVILPSIKNGRRA
ncbi:MAG: hypothetical protein IPJ30_08940 [Acidobacteria bacterium]|nr:hypothetical protein [Acidobacteriota bacterium]